MMNVDVKVVQDSISYPVSHVLQRYTLKNVKKQWSFLPSRVLMRSLFRMSTNKQMTVCLRIGRKGENK